MGDCGRPRARRKYNSILYRIRVHGCIFGGADCLAHRLHRGSTLGFGADAATNHIQIREVVEGQHFVETRYI